MHRSRDKDNRRANDTGGRAGNGELTMGGRRRKRVQSDISEPSSSKLKWKFPSKPLSKHNTHLAVAKAKQQRHAQALARGDHRGRDLVHGLPRRAGLRAKGRDHVLKPQERNQDERGPDRLARPARRRGRLVVAVNAAVVPLEAAPGKREKRSDQRGERGDEGKGGKNPEGKTQIEQHRSHVKLVIPKLSSIAFVPLPSRTFYLFLFILRT